MSQTNWIMNGPGNVTANVTTAGADASATGTATIKGLRGLLVRRTVNWHASAPAATSDITIVEVTDGGSFTIYSKTNSVTDIDSPTAVDATSTAGAALDPVADGPIYLRGGVITITIAQSDALTDCAIVELGTV